ncbi:hypothetical protein QBC37DRAFT_484817 [Rhypophila decipiens]|uniref:Uncharacterized protein n=1 Tax=Rhypophila decipiens TaxID=261697 RepID=A0AAN6Y2T0_9PEZI|nr:hypothetical protein QBC37DRAFT_484817 [Rhypophila decipiens]
MAEAVGVSLAILGLAGNLKGTGSDLGADYDPRLNDETALRLVSGILANIKHLLADGAELQRKYRLKSVDVSPDSPQGLLGDGSATGPPEDVLVSNSMMRRFTKDFQSLCIRTKLSQSTTSTKRKFLWVVGQKEKFEKLVNDLAHFVSKLNQIVPDRGVPSSMREFGDGLAQKIYQLMTDSSRRVFHMVAVPEDSPGNTSPQVAELAQLRMARDAARQDQTSRTLPDVADRILIQKSESIIIEAIWFRSLQARRDSIEPAHLKTLAWVLDSTHDTGEWDNLAKWLKGDNGVYWVSGKAGSQSPNIKVVVSSRPEPACVSAFSTLKKLRLQDLNRPDIQDYVESEVGANQYMQELREDDDAGCARLLEDLADRARGVFLWIILACRSLLDGFDSIDSLCELGQRLEELPRELADMFQHMLNKVPTRYHEQTAKLLKLAERCQVAPWHDDDLHRYEMPALTLSIMEHAKFRPESASFGHMSISEKKIACEKIEGRVRSRTGGLLEFVTLDSVDPLFCAQHELGLETLPISDREPARKKINSIVRFMHRTVFEFLHDSTLWETLNALQLATKGGFDPESVLAAMSTGLVHFTCRGEHLPLAVEQTLFFFRQIDQLSFPEATTKNICRLFDLAEKWMRPNRYQHNVLFLSPNSPSIPHSVLTFAAELGMAEFLDHNLHNESHSSHNGRQPLLFFALIQPLVAQNAIETRPGTSVPPSSRTASFLLDQGYHPMQQVSTNFWEEDVKTIWEAWLDRLVENADIRESKDSWEITMKMMDYGADPRLMREHNSNVVIWIFNLLIQYEDKHRGEQASDECHRLRKLLGEWHSRGRSYAYDGDESGGEINEWGDQVIIKRRRSKDDGPNSKRRRYNDDEE